MQFNTGFYVQGIIVTDKILILKNYIKTSFFLTVITICSLTLALFDNSEWINLGFIV